MTSEFLESLFETSEIISVIGLIFLANLTITGMEILLDLITKKTRRWKDSAANFAIFLVNEVLQTTAFGAIGFICLLPFYWLSPVEIPMTLWTWVVAFFIADFSYYWMHRMEHEHRILWASHSVHHSSEDYNLTVGFRLCLIEGLFEWIFLVPMILIGFNPFQAIIALTLVAQYQHWIHTERIHRLGWLDRWFNTPSVHRVHHGSNQQYLDKNYGGVLMVWDKLFGTFEPEDETVIYGLTRNIHSDNPVTINLSEFALLWKDVQKCQGWRDKMRMIFGELSWRPAYFTPPSPPTDTHKTP